MKKTIFFLLSFLVFSAQLVAETPVLQPSKVKQIDFEKGSKAFDSALKKYNQGNVEYDESKGAFINFTKEENEVFDETKEDFWDILGGACSWYCAGGPDTVIGSSHLKAQGKISYVAKNAHDHNYKNVWVEGVPGYGIGEYLTYKFKGGSPRVTTIIVVNGYVKSAKAYKENSRVKKLKVYKDNKPIAILELQDIIGEQSFDIGVLGNNKEGTPDWTLKFEIMEVYKGDKYDDTAISEIYFNGLDVHCLAKGTKIKMADGTEKTIEEIKEGDEVFSYSPGKNIGKSKVKAVESVRHTNYVTYTFKSGKSLTCTPDHPLFSPKSGWVSSEPEKSKIYKGYENVALVKEGTILLKADESDDPIVKIERGAKEQEFHTITILEDHRTGFFANDICVGTEELENK